MQSNFIIIKNQLITFSNFDQFLSNFSSQTELNISIYNVKCSELFRDNIINNAVLKNQFLITYSSNICICIHET